MAFFNTHSCLRIARTLAFASAFAGASANADCPPGTFDYGPLWPDPLVELVVLDHYAMRGGVGDPLIVLPADYERSARDMDIIRAEIEAAPDEHILGYVPNQIIIETYDPEGAELACWNDYFGAEMMPILTPPTIFYLVTLPRSVNVLRMAQIYMDVPEVSAAYVNGTSETCPNWWIYWELPSGTRRWWLAASSYWRGGCRHTGAWMLAVSADGELGTWCRGDVDESGGVIDLADVAALLPAFGSTYPDPAYMESADLDANLSIDIQDLATLLSEFGWGCP